jgi:G3E family GTPase
VTVVDTVTGCANLDRFAEAARQAAAADALYISKTDLAPFDAALARRLRVLNPDAERIVGQAQSDPGAIVFGTPSSVASGGSTPTLPSPASGGGSGWEPLGGAASGEATHTHGIAAYTVVFEGPFSRFDFARALGELARERGYDLLRVKGIVAFADEPDRPALIQAAQHAMLTPDWLDGWPDADRRSRLVFVVHDIAPAEILDRFAFAAPCLIGPPASRRGH